VRQARPASLSLCPLARLPTAGKVAEQSIFVGPLSIAELHVGELLFSTHSNTEHLCLMERVLGRFPHWMVNQGKYGSKYFDADGGARVSRMDHEGQRRVRRTRTLERLIREEGYSPQTSLPRAEDGGTTHGGVETLIRVLHSCLVFDPHTRPPAETILQTEANGLQNAGLRHDTATPEDFARWGR